MFHWQNPALKFSKKTWTPLAEVQSVPVCAHPSVSLEVSYHWCDLGWQWCLSQRTKQGSCSKEVYQVHVSCHHPANCKKAATTTVEKKAKTPHPLLANLILSNFLGKLEPTGENYPTWLNTLSRSRCCHLSIFLLARKEPFSCRQAAWQNREWGDVSLLRLPIHTSSLVQKLEFQFKMVYAYCT